MCPLNACIRKDRSKINTLKFLPQETGKERAYSIQNKQNKRITRTREEVNETENNKPIQTNQ